MSSTSRPQNVSRSRFTWPLVAALAALALAIGATACGDDDSVSQADLDQAVSEAQDDAAAPPAEVTTTETTTEAQAAPSSGGSRPAGVPADADDCGGGVFAKAGTTSCDFALNVAADYKASNQGQFDSFSPTTGETYTMSCTASPVVCSGGNNAAVYIAP